MDAIKHSIEATTQGRAEDLAPYTDDHSSTMDPDAGPEVREDDPPGWKDCLLLLKRLGLPLSDRHRIHEAYEMAVRDLERRLTDEAGRPHTYDSHEWENVLLRRFVLRRLATEVWREEVTQAGENPSAAECERVADHLGFETRAQGHPLGRRRELLDPMCWDLQPLVNESESERFLHLHRLTALLVYQDEARASAGVTLSEAAQVAVGMPGPARRSWFRTLLKRRGS